MTAEANSNSLSSRSYLRPAGEAVLSSGWFFVGCSELLLSRFIVQGSVSDVQGSIFDVQRSAFSVQRSAFSVQRSAFNVRCSIFRVRCSGFDVFPLRGSFPLL